MPRIQIDPLVVLAGVLFSGSVAAAQELVELTARVNPSVVHITTHDALGQERGSGTGFFISGDGWIVTNDHVIEDASQVRVRLFDQRQLEAEGVLVRNYDRDLAIIKVPGGDHSPLQLAAGGRLPVGARVMVVGGPMGLTWSQTSGLISAYLEHGLPERLRGSDRRRGGPLIQMDAAISPGSSGSPVLDAITGEVIGVAVSIITGARGLNFAVPVDAVQELMLSVEPDRQPESFGTFLWQNLLISTIFFVVLACGYVVWRHFTGRGRQRGS